ncbi:hypothetical protein [Salipiger thiooxidans]|uniref:hypothetical protein n=1 Tax=Salipiger thiooxidans TaxID=282683 RepID=UPI001CD72AFE|nr:hypothetical protein [Salipiger thiooxidans]MCA0849778.1 hypothetical protein [Salipiger thiooxidans]
MNTRHAITGAIMLAFGATAVSDQAQTLRIATSVPQTHYLTVSIAAFADEVTERTNGDITFEI